MSNEFYSGVKVFEVEKDLIDEVYKNKELAFWDNRHSWYPNMYCVLKDGNGASALTKVKDGKLQLLPQNLSAGNIRPKNKEQVFALDALLDPDIKVVVLTGRAGSGKAQPLTAKILTPDGWKLMGELQIGNEILTPKGEITHITGIFPQGEKDIYKINFSDGSFTECCDDHLWYVYSQKDRDAKRIGSVKSLKEIKAKLRYGICNKKNFSIPMVSDISFKEKNLPIDPYTLGALLGDGSFRHGITFSSQDSFIIQKIEKILQKYDLKCKQLNQFDYKISSKLGVKNNYLKKTLIKLRLYGKKSPQKFIPDIYKFSSKEHRIEILQGLMDTDGTVDKKGMSVSFSTTSKLLANDVQFLVQSLGGKGVIRHKQTYFTYQNIRKAGLPSFVVHIALPNNIEPFSLPRKMQRIRKKTKYFPTRYIDTIEYIGKKEAQCISIEDPMHLYVTDHFIVTHNTLLSLGAAVQGIETKLFKRLILSRIMTQVGQQELGILPGELNDKFRPYLLNYMCNLELIIGAHKDNMDDLADRYNAEFMPFQLIRGASFHNSFVLIDEAQTLGHHEMLTLGTRIGMGSKLVVLGDLKQRDTKIAKDKTGIFKFVNSDLAKESPLVASIELLKSERSAVATLFADIFEE